MEFKDQIIELRNEELLICECEIKDLKEKLRTAENLIEDLRENQ